MVAVSVSFAALGAGVIAIGETGIGAAFGLAFLAIYGVISGRIGLRRGYNHRDRFLVIFGVCIGCGLIVGLALKLFVA